MMSMPRLAEPTTRTGATRPRTYSPYYLSFYLVFSVVKHTYLSLSFSRLSRLVVSLSITQSNTQAILRSIKKYLSTLYRLRQNCSRAHNNSKHHTLYLSRITRKLTLFSCVA